MTNINPNADANPNANSIDNSIENINPKANAENDLNLKNKFFATLKSIKFGQNF